MQLWKGWRCMFAVLTLLLHPVQPTLSPKLLSQFIAQRILMKVTLEFSVFCTATVTSPIYTYLIVSTNVSAIRYSSLTSYLFLLDQCEKKCHTAMHCTSKAWDSFCNQPKWKHVADSTAAWLAENQNSMPCSHFVTFCLVFQPAEWFWYIFGWLCRLPLCLLWD